MLNLASVNDRLQIITSAAATLHVHASWVDVNTSSGVVTPGRTNTIITTATTTNVVAGPAAGVQRNVKTLHIFNPDGISNDITVQLTDGTIVSQLWKGALATNETIEYTDQGGFVRPTGAFQRGITDGSNAAAGIVGEYTFSTTPSGSAVSLLSNTVTQIASITLSPGDWEVRSVGAIRGDVSTTIGAYEFGIATSIAIPAAESGQACFHTEYNQNPFNTVSAITRPIGPCRFNVTVSTPLYLVAAVAGGGNILAFGTISARRVR
jgi:hypothetical protein